MESPRENLIDLVEKESHLQVVLGDDPRYILKGYGATSFQLDSSDTLYLSDVLFVSRMKMINSPYWVFMFIDFSNSNNRDFIYIWVIP